MRAWTWAFAASPLELPVPYAPFFEAGVDEADRPMYRPKPSGKERALSAGETG